MRPSPRVPLITTRLLAGPFVLPLTFAWSRASIFCNVARSGRVCRLPLASRYSCPLTITCTIAARHASSISWSVPVPLATCANAMVQPTCQETKNARIPSNCARNTGSNSFLCPRSTFQSCPPSGGEFWVLPLEKTPLRRNNRLPHRPWLAGLARPDVLRHAGQRP